MKIIIAPDSFKGSLSARDAAEAIAAGIRRVRPEADLVLVPLADGGEGTTEALVTATGGVFRPARVRGPLGDPVDAVWGLLGDRQTAVVEMAAASGLPLVPAGRRDPRRATTYGTGELIRAALDAGVTRLIVGLGGSATNDGGAGAMQALGARFLDTDGRPLPDGLGGAALTQVARIDLACLPALAGSVAITIASDVTNPLVGPNGASAIYGPQKGADAAAVAELDAALAHYAGLLARDLGKDVAALPGAGAAGGLGAGLIAFLGATVRSGIDLVLDAAGFEAQARGADWVFTGEGKIDAQTAQGKTICGVLARCARLQVPVLAFGGAVEEAAMDTLAAQGLRAAVPIVPGPLTLEEAMRNGASLLTAAAARVMRLLTA